MNDLHVMVLVTADDVIVDVCIQILHIWSNADLKDLLKVNTKTDGDVYPLPFLVACPHKSDVV